MKRVTPVATATAIAIFVLASLPGPAWSALDDMAGPFVADLGKRAVAVFVDSSTSENEKAARFGVIFREGFAVKAIAAFSLGRYYKKTDAAFFDEFVDVFDEYVARSYAARFAANESPVFEVVEVVPDHNPDGSEIGVLVTSHVYLPGGTPTPVEWRVRDLGGRPVIVDVVAEGISLAITQQKEFTAVIGSNGGDPRALLDLLREKNLQLSEN